MIALSPVVSWVLFLGCVAVGVTVYVGASAWLDRRERRLLSDAHTLEQLGRDINALYVRVLPTVYDWQARDDFGDQRPWVWDRSEP